DRHIYGRYCQLQLRSIAPPLHSYDPLYETILRSHPQYQNVMNFARENKVDNYAHGNMAQMFIQALLGVNENMGHFGVCLPASCSTYEIEKFANQSMYAFDFKFKLFDINFDSFSVMYPLLKIPIHIEERLCDVHEDLRPIKLDKYQKFAV